MFTIITITKAAEIYSLIRLQPGLTNKDIREKTLFSRRTVYTILKNLEKEGKIVKKASLKDARMNHYFPSIQ